jgi:Flp pilus assembly protein TadB
VFGAPFDEVMQRRRDEMTEYYDTIVSKQLAEEEKRIVLQGFAGMRCDGFSLFVLVFLVLALVLLVLVLFLFLVLLVLLFFFFFFFFFFFLLLLLLLLLLR